MVDKLDYTEDGSIARITIDRPNKRNCLDVETLESWSDSLEIIQKNSDIKVLTVRGAGENFSTGADLSMLLEAIHSGNRARIEEFIDNIHSVTGKMEELDVPTIAAIEGYALAGGLEVLLACDLRIAAENAIIGDQHANYGLVAGGGGTQRLIRQIDTCRANELMYTGRRLSGSEAAEWNIVNKAVPSQEFEAEVLQLEKTLAEKSGDAAALTKSLMREGSQMDKKRGLDLERISVIDHYFTEEAIEGFEAFNEGREPKFDHS